MLRASPVPAISFTKVQRESPRLFVTHCRLASCDYLRKREKTIGNRTTTRFLHAFPDGSAVTPENGSF